MTLPKHKAAAYTEQIRQHGPMTTVYGQEKGEHPNRKVARGGAQYHPDDDSPEAHAWREEERDLYPH